MWQLRWRWLRFLSSLFIVTAISAQTTPLVSEPNTTTAADSVITFNELMYHPAGEDPGMEWLELYNQMSVNMDISGWKVVGGIEFQFPTNTVLPADSYLVVAANPDRMRTSTGRTNIYGPFSGRLSSSGETIRVRNQSGRLMDEMTYSDEDPWPVGPDGSGATLAKRDRYNASSPAANWRASAQTGGTPGYTNFDAPGAPEPPPIPLITMASESRWLVPQNELLGASWISPAFDDTQWAAGKASLGYDTGSTGPVDLSNVALNKTVIDGSGAYHSNPFDVADGAGNFIAQNVTDGSVADIFGQNYWLGREGMLNESFTLDLGQSFQIAEIHLRNTHNTQHNDRGTASFEIWASQSVNASKQLINPVRILTGTLNDVAGLSPIPAEIFKPENGLIITSARYLKFVGITANYSGNNLGLNEIEVYAPAFSGPDRAYSFNGNLNDASGAGINGQNIGAQFSTNIPPAITAGQSLEFGGVSSQVHLPDPVNPRAYTVAMWVNVETVRSSSVIVRTDSSGPLSEWSHQLRINGSGRFEHYIFDGTGRSVAATNTIVPHVWYHVAITGESDGDLRIYVNGIQSGVSPGINTLWPGGNQWRLGTDAGNAANFFHGRIDELAIWHSVLDQGTINILASGRSPSQLGGYHRFFSTDLQAPLYNKNSSYLLRIPFENVNRQFYEQLTLRLRYADGFAAFLNGTEIARRNAPQTLLWNSAATLNRGDAEAINIETIDLSAHASRINSGGNVLAVQVMNSIAGDPASLFSMELLGQAVRSGTVTNVGFSEVAGATNRSFFVELRNFGESPASLEGCSILSSSGGHYQFQTNILGAGAYQAFFRNELGFPVQEGDRLFLLGPGGDLIDAVIVQSRARGRSTSDPWLYPSRETPGEANTFNLQTAIVINEILYHHPPTYKTPETRFAENDEQWIELYNTSGATADLSGWSLDGEVAYLIPAGTMLAPDAYLVIANDSLTLRAKYTNITVIGNFDRRLSHHSAHVILRDAAGNPADEVRYHNSHPWPQYANGGGSSLELRDPRSDNIVPQSWSASNEAARTQWKRYSYRATAIRPVYTPGIFSFHEFRMGLLDEGEALVDNVSVTELPTTGASRQLLQNSSFSSGTSAWRLLGNHSHSVVKQNPDAPNEPVLHLIATGSTSYLDNRLETTLKAGGAIVPVVTGRDYEISFDAKWVAGSPQLHTELYYNKVAATTILDTPTHCGTPGQRNSVYITNSGPTYSGLAHSPVIPSANEAIDIRVAASDPDGIGTMQLYYSINGGAWWQSPMSADALYPSRYTAIIPRQSNGAVIQFYIEGTDSRGAFSAYPAAGPNSRALIKVDSERIVSGKQTFRTIMTGADSTLLHSAINMMSDDLLGCTMVHQEREVFYDARIRLHGSMFSRNQPNLTGMTIKFPADHRFRGSRESVIVRRRGLVETFVKHILNSAGGLPGNYDDVVHLVSHRSDNTGTARLNLANYDDTYVDSQFEGDNDGTVFKLEGIREYQTTQNGDPEGLKLSQPIGWIQTFDIANLGDNSEQYRWGIMIQSERQRDDYSGIVAMAKAFSLSGNALREAASETIDVDKWSRLFALQSLLGIGDVYGVENPHNFAFYVRPSDGRVVGLQNDWEFAFSGATSASIYGSKNVYKLFRLPGFQRLYQGHILDLLDSVVNSAYLTPWARHYTTLIGENHNSFPGYAASRGTSARSQLAARISFEITSNDGVDMSVTTPFVVLQGRGWIDAYRIHRTGDASPLTVSWIDDQRWQATIPLASGTNSINLRAYNFRGVQVGEDRISVVTTATEFPQRDYLRISELMYHPAPPSLSEINAGFADADDFEFVELLNTGPVDLPLNGVKFTGGVTFDFTTGTITNLHPSERILLVKNHSAFQYRYGTNNLVAGEYAGNLSNSGELLRLVDGFDAVIHEFAYGDEGAWPDAADGSGRSLEVRDFSGPYNDPSNWQASASPRGSPGSSSPNPATISAIVFNNGQVRLSFQAAPWLSYEIYACDNLTSDEWSLVEQIPAQDDFRMEEFTDKPIESSRFYRIITF